MGRRGPRPQTFAKWLRSLHAAKLSCETDDGEKIVKVPTNRAGAQRIADAVDTVGKLHPSRCSALAEDGDVLGVWEFEEPRAEPAPGYTKDDKDTEEERLLKTFAHLLADAHKEASKAFVDAMRQMAQSFGDERKASASAMMAMDRTMQRLQRTTARFRIATPEGDDEPDEEPDTFLKDMLGPIVQRMVRDQVSGEAPQQGPPPNGKGKG